MNHSEIVSFLWGVADLIRDTFKRGKYQDIILSLTVLRRLDCVLAGTKETVLARQAELQGKKLENLDPQLRKSAGFAFYNTSRYDFDKLLADAPHLAANLRNYIAGFSPNMREVLEKFDFDNTIAKLDAAGLLFQVLERFRNVDLHPDRTDNPEPDPELRDTESVPLAAGDDPADVEGVPASVRAFFEREVKPHVPDAWIDTARRDPRDGQVGLVGYEINFNRYFYRLRFAFEGPILTAAIRATFLRRRTPFPDAEPLALRDKFLAAPERQTQWRAFLRRGRLDAPPDANDLTAVLRRFLGPVLAAAARNDALAANWPPGGPWQEAAS